MRFVLALSIGPVGGFIAAGRRSRDLWFASSWLSETTRRVAESLDEVAPEGVRVELLLPTRRRLAELKQAYDRTQGLDGGRVSNKVLALVDVEGAPDAQAALQALAAGARERARALLIEELSVLRDDRRLVNIVDRQAIELQMKAIDGGDFLEFSAGWAPLRGEEPFFGDSVGRACELRDATPKLFRHPEFSRPGVARSDLDEGRDSVLRDGPELRVERARAGFIESEELDAIGLLRRAGPYLRRGVGRLRTLPFRPTPNAAAAPWLEGVGRHPEAARELRGLRDVMHRAAESSGEDFFVWGSPARCTAPPEASFPYEAGLLFENGCDALLAAVERLDQPGAKAAPKATPGSEWGGAARARDALRHARRHVQNLHRHVGQPIPYYAFLELDGDKVGSLLKAQKRHHDYDRLVRALDDFARGAADAVELEQGTAFYVAGDELAAYVPLDRALALAGAIAKLFHDTLHKEGYPGRAASAAIVFAHFKDDLRGVRDAAKKALQQAKEANGAHLCVLEMPRSGSARRVLGPFDDTMGGERSLIGRLDALVEAIAAGEISLRTEQHLRDHYERFRDDTAPGAAPSTAAAGRRAGVPPGVRLAQDAVRRQFERAQRDSQHLLIERVNGLATWPDVVALADEIRIASRIADVRRQRRQP